MRSIDWQWTMIALVLAGTLALGWPLAAGACGMAAHHDMGGTGAGHHDQTAGQQTYGGQMGQGQMGMQSAAPVNIAPRPGTGPAGSWAGAPAAPGPNVNPGPAGHAGHQHDSGQ